MKHRFWNKKIRNLLIVAGVLATIFTLTAALRQGAGTGLGENAVNTLLTPFRSALSWVDRSAEEIYDYMFRFQKLRAENEALKQEVARQNAAVDAAESYRRENRRLRELLGLEQESEEFSYEAAYVIGWDNSVWEERITIDKGTAHGLKEGMCAITSTGQVVGLITQCGVNWATVSTIGDISLQVSAQVASSGYSGVVQTVRTDAGQEELQMRYLPQGASFMKGDRVVTTGGELFPRGLLLGTIRSSALDETGISKYAVLDTELEMGTLEQVFIIVREDS